MPDGRARPDDPLNALTDEDVRVAGDPQGPLQGLAFVAKDLYDVAGHRTGAGSPAWLDAQEPAGATAPAIAALLAAGADLVAKSHTDELAWSLLGQNAHYGTPINPRSRDRVPGGSSSGSVVAAASGMVDFAVGSDTGGSVRVPASNCGVYGIRTTHGAIPLGGVVPLAPCFDTVGWFARDAEVMQRVGSALLSEVSTPKGSAVVAGDAFAIADPEVESILGAASEQISKLLDGSMELDLSSRGLAEWASAWRTIQAREIWRAHGTWVDENDPPFGPGIRERFDWARTVSAEDEERARAVQSEARDELEAALAKGAVILAPSVPSVAPRRDETADALEVYRTRAMALTCSAGLAGLPQISIPAGDVGECPVGLGVIGPAGSDLWLLELARRHAAANAGDQTTR
ncbi:MAG: amidase [Gaiellaceae bacterium]